MICQSMWGPMDKVHRWDYCMIPNTKTPSKSKKNSKDKTKAVNKPRCPK